MTMPWLENVSAVLETWYPGIRGGEAISNILFGKVNPSAKLPVTFPKSESDLPHPILQGPPPRAVETPVVEGQGPRQRPPEAPFDIDYSIDALKVGYKWFDADNKEPLFAFGHGLSYTTYSYSHLKVTHGKEMTASFIITNTGKRAGAEIAQVYVSLPPSAGEPPKRLVAWDKVQLLPGQSKTVTLTMTPQFLSIFNANDDRWEMVPGAYKVFVGRSFQSLPLTQTVDLAGQVISTSP